MQSAYLWLWFGKIKRHHCRRGDPLRVETDGKAVRLKPAWPLA